MAIKRYTAEAKECVYPGKGSFILFSEDENWPLVLHADHRLLTKERWRKTRYCTSRWKPWSG